jgi:DNA polymerase-1
MTHNGLFRNPFEFDRALQEPVFYMMRRGFRVDVGMKARLQAEYQGQWEKHQKNLDIIAGGTLNVSSPKQMKDFFYGELKLPPRRKDGSLTLDEDACRALLAIAENNMREAKTDAARYKWQRAFLGLTLVLKIRGVRKRKESYLDVALDPDGRMRTLLRVGGAETGRLTASKTLWDTGCNLQTIPVELRKMFIADDDMEIGEFDLNRGESWVYAHLSGDPELIRIHTSMGDFHSETASAISVTFGGVLSVEEVIKLYKSGDYLGYKIRFVGKKVNHASAYRMGPFRGAEVINEESDDTGITITVAQMKMAQALWQNKYAGIKDWWAWIDNKMNEDRTLETPYGRKRTFFGWYSDQLLKEATAYVPQSTSADYLNIGMLKTFRKRVQKGMFELLHNNHDSIVIQYPRALRDEVLGQVIEDLTSTVRVRDYQFSIPIEAKYGPSWGELTEWHG